MFTNSVLLIIKQRPFFSVFILAWGLASCNSSRNILQETKLLPDYPSASGIEFHQNHYYVIGDDANQLIILDSSLKATDSLALYHYSEKRIPKKIKPDLESISLLDNNQLLLLGSGSLSPYRNITWLIDPTTKKKDSIRLDTFYSRIGLQGIHELNIEGATTYPGGFILANRGSKGYPKNHLIFTRRNFWNRQSMVEINSMLAGSQTDSSVFSGISGICYAPGKDALLLTISTEDTRNSMDDGAIGTSYLWIINNISSKKNWKAVNPDQIINLDELDARFKGQKIESVCISRESKSHYYLVLAADNDNGSSTLFKLVVGKD